MLQALVETGDVLLHRGLLPEELRRNRIFTCAAVIVNEKAWSHVAPELLRDRAFILEAANNSSSVLSHASEELRNDPELVLAVIRRQPMALKWASKVLAEDSDLQLIAYAQARGTVKLLPRNGSAGLGSGQIVKSSESSRLEPSVAFQTLM